MTSRVCSNRRQQAATSSTWPLYIISLLRTKQDVNYLIVIINTLSQADIHDVESGSSSELIHSFVSFELPEMIQNRSSIVYYVQSHDAL